MKSLELLSVELPLLLFTRKPIPQKKTDFGAIEADALGAKFTRALHVGGDARIDP